LIREIFNKNGILAVKDVIIIIVVIVIIVLVVVVVAVAGVALVLGRWWG
jgi:hypothetical protein